MWSNFLNKKEYSLDILIKKILEIFFLTIIFSFIIFNLITLERLKYFILVMILINIYSLFSYLIGNFINVILKNKEIYEIKIYEKFFLSIFLFIYNIINPFIYLHINILPLIYNHIRWVNYVFSEKISYRYITIFKNFILDPFYRLFLIFYKVLNKFKERTIIELIFYRSYGLIISILFMGSLFIYLYSNIFLLVVLGYGYLVILGFLPIKISLKIDKDLINPLFYNVLLNRMESTILGRILYNYLIKKELQMYFNNIYFCESNLKKYYVENIINRLISDDKELKREKKYQPSYGFYCELKSCLTNISDINEIYFGLELVNLSYEDKLVVKTIFEKRKKLIKKILFMVWDIEEYLKLKNDIIYGNDVVKNIRIDFDYNIEKFYLFSQGDFIDIKDYVYEFLPIFIYGLRNEEFVSEEKILDKIIKYNIYHEDDLFKEMEKFLNKLIEEIKKEWEEKKVKC